MSEQEQFIVVVNHVNQYSIWSASRRIPLGWEPVGFTGTKSECFAYIKRTWRPDRRSSDSRAAAYQPSK